METDIKEINQNILHLRKEIELIKNILLSEGELADWAKDSLAEARKEKEDEYTDTEDLWGIFKLNSLNLLLNF